MNGAAAVVDRIMRTPKTRSIVIMGRSHHFLLCMRKPKNSLQIPPPAFSAAIFSNSVDGSFFIDFSPVCQKLDFPGKIDERAERHPFPY